MSGEVNLDSDWDAKRLAAARPTWEYSLTADVVDELLSVASAEGFLGRLPDLSRPSDRVRHVWSKLPDLTESLSSRSGIGLALIHGLPVASMSVDELRTVYWLIGCSMGTPMTQNTDGASLVDVRDETKGEESLRGYRSAEALPYHTDYEEFAGLACVRPAMKGGSNQLANSRAVVTRLLREKTRLYASLQSPMPHGRLGEEKDGEAPWVAHPAITGSGGPAFTFFNPPVINHAQKAYDVPPLTEEQKEAIEYVEAAADSDEFRFDIRLGPGDVIFMNSYLTVHSRSAFEDSRAPEESRHYLRLWIRPDDSVVPDDVRYPYDFGALGKSAW